MMLGKAAQDEAVFSGESLQIDDGEFERLRSIVYKRLGIQLTEHKRGLVVGRLQRHLHQLGIHSFSKYCDYVEADTTGTALEELANRISTNHTFFFREPAHLSIFSERVLPEMTASIQASGARDLRVWCAACATGEEAYTLAMLIQEHLGSDRRSWQAGLLATDISQRALERAREGVYDLERVRDVPPVLRQKYLRKVDAEHVSVDQSLRGEVTFRRLNLVDRAYPFRRPFHAIFCRNVMIYFDSPTRAKLVQAMHAMLVPGGYFFVGHSESLQRGWADFQVVAPAAYQKGAK